MFTVKKKVAGENNKEYSYRILKDAIMSLELKPGQAISEAELAIKLQISRTPIREVMAKLREEHLVEVRPQVGTYVSKINPLLIEEAAFMRYALEREVLKLSCEEFPEEGLYELKKIVSLQERLSEKGGSALEFHELDKQFHKTIYQGNQKENVWEAIMRLSTHYNRIRLLDEMEHSFKTAIQQHREIIEKIETKNLKKIDECIRQHILKPTQQWAVLYSETSPYVDYFDFAYKMPVF
ncbi:GntR family transcriptional regulator [Bacillus sp. Marseille-P3661]|uniref:GntR family transcriptional regulator n=1 Tax=Bacillus sp. Marseille-P3661 TaxID=1936234 RepID=UPI000C81BC27|nr:GntR family transcriptional regulator [Bacillus sp. Marseille-P3661]